MQLPTKIGYAAVKYADLKNNRVKDYVFDYDKMLSPDGDTAVYLFYAYARVCSMLAKVEATTGKSIDEIIAGSASISRNDKFEWNMASIILHYPDVLEKTADDLTPHVLCEYVYRTAGKFQRVLEQLQNSGKLHFLFFRFCLALDLPRRHSLVEIMLLLSSRIFHCNSDGRATHRLRPHIPWRSWS